MSGRLGGGAGVGAEGFDELGAAVGGGVELEGDCAVEAGLEALKGGGADVAVVAVEAVDQELGVVAQAADVGGGVGEVGGDEGVEEGVLLIGQVTAVEVGDGERERGALAQGGERGVAALGVGHVEIGKERGEGGGDLRIGDELV